MTNETKTPRPVLINGQWRQANHQTTFQATDPNHHEMIAEIFPVSEWSDCEEALDAASEAAREIRSLSSETITSLMISSMAISHSGCCATSLYLLIKSVSFGEYTIRLNQGFNLENNMSFFFTTYLLLLISFPLVKE